MTLLKAFEKNQVRKAKLLLIGNGNDKDYLKNFIIEKEIDYSR